MKKSHLVAIILATIVVFIASGISVFAGSNFFAEKYEPFDEEKILNDLRLMDINELIAETNEIGKISSTGTDMIYHASVLLERISEVDESHILEIIDSDEYCLPLRITMIQITGRNSSELLTNPKIVSKLRDPNIENSIKVNILLELGCLDNPDIALFRELALGENDELAFQAIKCLWWNDVGVAYEIADVIMNKPELFPETTERYRAALFGKAAYFLENPYDSRIEEFAQHCAAIMNRATTSERNMLEESGFFALIDMKSEVGLREVMKSEFCETSDKGYAADRHWNVLFDLLNNNPSDEDLLFVLKCLNYAPMHELIDMLDTIFTGRTDSLAKESLEVLDKLKNSEDLYDIVR